MGLSRPHLNKHLLPQAGSAYIMQPYVQQASIQAFTSSLYLKPAAVPAGQKVSPPV